MNCDGLFEYSAILTSRVVTALESSANAGSSELSGESIVTGFAKEGTARGAG